MIRLYCCGLCSVTWWRDATRQPLLIWTWSRHSDAVVESHLFPFYEIINFHKINWPFKFGLNHMRLLQCLLSLQPSLSSQPTSIYLSLFFAFMWNNNNKEESREQNMTIGIEFWIVHNNNNNHFSDAVRCAGVFFIISRHTSVFHSVTLPPLDGCDFRKSTECRSRVASWQIRWD